ncbi:MAG: hypothetical protein QXX36_00005 [Candidatus Rehaiarchaeum fermentans]|nr:hypothetical protein [Candidatus Rehaiarchaeum fermentans]MCW1297555.1 hypothetical protein [Candidatus Rehaiarchaeum fermentans]MCW1302014.1 hypothetical protein [Candidatus Rehaiarchaeum fermentans]
MAEILKKSAVKDYVKGLDKDMRFPDDTVEDLEKAVKELIKKAVERAKQNDRKTVRGFDF